MDDLKKTEHEAPKSEVLPNTPPPSPPAPEKMTLQVGALDENLSKHTIKPHPTSPTAITLADNQKLTIQVESGTDWPSVLATLAVGCVIAWFAWNTHKNQIRSSVATFRHDWQGKLRERIAEFLSKVSLLHSKMQLDPTFLQRADSDELYSEIILVQCTIELMLDRTKQSSIELTRLMEETIETVRDDRKSINQVVNDLNSKAQEVLELAWKDIKADLGMKKKKQSEH